MTSTVETSPSLLISFMNTHGSPLPVSTTCFRQTRTYTELRIDGQAGNTHRTRARGLSECERAEGRVLVSSHRRHAVKQRAIEVGSRLAPPAHDFAISGSLSRV